MNEPLYTMALITGLLGSGHCIGMCGPLVTALSFSSGTKPGGIVFHILYNTGRLITYTLAGAIAGWFGSAALYANTFANISQTVLIASDCFIIIIGLGAAGLFSKLNFIKLEFFNPTRIITKLVAILRNLPASLAAFPLGLIMGFLPCGFLYAMIITAGQSNAPETGAIVMLFFGLGTVPALFLVGSLSHWLSVRARNWMLRTAGLVVATMGAYNLYRHLQATGCCS